MNKFAKFYKKMVLAVTTFFAGVSGLFLLAGAGTPGIRLMVAAIFFISFINLSVDAREMYLKLKDSRPGGVKPEPKSDGKQGGGEPTKPGGGQNGGG